MNNSESLERVEERVLKAHQKWSAAKTPDEEDRWLEEWRRQVWVRDRIFEALGLEFEARAESSRD